MTAKARPKKTATLGKNEKKASRAKRPSLPHSYFYGQDKKYKPRRDANGWIIPE